MMQRRRFVTGAGGLLIAAGLLPAALVEAAHGVDFRKLDLTGGFTKSKFKALLDETFYIRTGAGGPVMVRLVDLEDRRTHGRRLHPLRTAQLEQFSAFFQGPTLPALAPGLYSIEHELAGKALINLEPTARCCYRADFSLLA